MSKLKQSPKVSVELTAMVLLASVLSVLVSSVGHAQSTRYTLGSYCELVLNLSHMNHEPVAAKSLNDDWEKNCTKLDWEKNANSEYNGPINPLINSNPAKLRTNADMNENIETAQSIADVEGRFDTVRAVVNQMLSECRARAARAMAPSQGDMDSILAGLASESAGAKVESLCSRIPGYQTRGNQGQQEAAQTCQQFNGQCSSLLSDAEERLREMRGTVKETATMTQARGVIANSCQIMGSVGNEMQELVTGNTAKLNQSCSAARARVPNTVAKEDPKKDETKTSENNLSNPSLQDSSGLMGLNSQSQLGMGNSSEMPVFNGGVDASGATQMGALKGDGDRSSAGLNTSALILNADSLGEQATPYERKKHGQPNMNSANSGQGPQASSARASQADRKAGRTARGNFGTNVYSGIQASMGASGSRRGDGFPYEAQVGHSGSRMHSGHSQSHGTVDLRKFLPNAGDRRPSAATGPDGITGPHTNLFAKVHFRYKIVPLNVGRSARPN